MPAMKTLFHRLAGLSIGAGIFAAAMLGLPATAQAPASSSWYGRWIISEDRPAFTSRGRAYKTIDIAPCGKDFCGVSVADDGKCGTVLFRFFGYRAKEDSYLQGHGKWGSVRKNVVIYSYDVSEGGPAKWEIELYLGEGYDFGGRSENMPKFHGVYRRDAAAQCLSR